MKGSTRLTWGLSVAIVALAALTVQAGQPVAPGTVIFDMDTNLGFCDPDFWSFFGNPLTDFGSNGSDAEDGHAIQAIGDWTVCDLVYGEPGCQFIGAKHGGGRINGQPLCQPLGSGVRDADLDLSAGTGITIRVLLQTPDFGQPGVRLQFQLADTNGLVDSLDPDTTAVVPRSIAGKPWINRTPPLKVDQWQTYTFWFAGLDSSFDASAIAGLDPLDLTNINAVRTIFRRGPTSEGKNKIVFDEITLIDDPPVLWADRDADFDVDVDDFAAFQRCFGADPTVDETCAPLDANYDDVIDINDFYNFTECLQGPGVTTGFRTWCY